MKKLLIMALGGMLAASCADLDTEPQGSTVTADQKAEVVANDPSKVSASVSGITSMFSVYEKFYSRHYDYGYATTMLELDSRGIDMVGEDVGYNWYTYGLDLTDRSLTAELNVITWRTLYNQVLATNDVAKLIDVETDNPTLKFYLAQALAIRAFDYMTLAQIYQFTYEGNEDAPCVPLLLDTNVDEMGALGGAPRATVGEVYAQVIEDLTNAINLLENNSVSRDDKRYISLDVAYGLRARANLIMQNWQAAAADAQAAISAATYASPISISEASQPGFVDMSEKDWMWGIKIEETDRVVTSAIVNWPSHMGSLNYGYASVGAWRRINKSLYDMINPTDARKGWFINEQGVSSNLNEEQQAYISNTAKAPAYTQVKFAPYQGKIYQDTNANDIPLMRIEEMYLILAEAQAMGGNPSAGKSTLVNFVRTYRDSAYNTNAGSAEDVQNAVWVQRRIELWGEGLSYFDLMRLRKGIDRASTEWKNMKDKEDDNSMIQYNYRILDTKAAERVAIEAVKAGKGTTTGEPVNALIYQIPNFETESNPQINDADNNLGAPDLQPILK